MTTQIASDTELSAVISILGSIGQSPVTTLGTVTNNTTTPATELVNTYANPQIALIHNILMESNKNVQNEGWHFNKEDNIKIEPDNFGLFVVPPNYLRMDMHEGQYDKSRDVVRKDGKLYDNVHHTNIFTQAYYFDITYLFAFDDVPPPIQRLIITRASIKAATQLVSNPDLVKLLQLEEVQNKSAALEYDTEMGDYTFFGLPQETSYRSYQPYKALIR